MERILRENGFDQATVKVFIDNNVDMEVFSSLQSADFQELGITSFGCGESSADCKLENTSMSTLLSMKTFTVA